MTTPSTGTRRLNARILAQLDACLELSGDLAVLELRRPTVSEWGVGDHLEHLVRVDRGILKVLEQAEPLAEGGGPTAIGRAVLFFGAIPRGRGRAPSFVQPRGEGSADLAPDLRDIRHRLVALGDDLGRLASLGPLARHHVFGALDALQWLRFVAVHHHHHWKIVRDIRRT